MRPLPATGSCSTDCSGPGAETPDDRQVRPPRRSRSWPLLAVIAAWNVLRYPPGLGYDAVDHIAYAQGILDGKGLPGRRRRVLHAARLLHRPRRRDLARRDARARRAAPRHAARRRGAPARDGGASARAGPARLPGPPTAPRSRRSASSSSACWRRRSAAMVHPETMSMFFSTLALVLAARMIVRRAWTVPGALAVGAALGAGQLVRAFSLWTFARRRARARDRRDRRGATSAAGSSSPCSSRCSRPRRSPGRGTPTSRRATRTRSSTARRCRCRCGSAGPLSFYVDPRLREVFGSPSRPHFDNRFFPELYADGWGDYYGVFVWTQRRPAPEPGRAASPRGADVPRDRADAAPRRRLARAPLAVARPRSGCAPLPSGCSSRCCRSPASSGCCTSPSATRRPTAT